MDDQDKSKEQLVAELAALRQRVTVLEQTEKSLRESEERYHTVVESVPQLLGWADANRHTIEWNQRWYRYTGQTPAEARGLGWLKTLHPDDVARVTQRISETRVTGGPYEVEYRVRRASDGAYRWYLARSMPMKDKNGRITGWFGSATDIDDQKRAEEALRESEQRFRKVFEEGPIGILLVGTDGRIQRANRRFCEMLGYAESEIIALGPAGISHPDDWERDYPFISRLWRGEISSYQVEKRYLRKNGQAVWAQLTVSLMHDEAGGPINTIAMIEDITERKRAEKTLQHSERTLRTLMDASPESMMLLNPEGTILLANVTMAHRYGTTADKIVGRNFTDRLPTEVAATRTGYIQEVVRTGKAVRFEDERFDRYIESALHPILDDQGKVTAVAILGIDRTERKRAEHALQQAHDELERRVEERTAELREVNEQLVAVYDGMVDGILLTDIETTHFVIANAAICRMLGYSEPELLSLELSDIHPADALPHILETILSAAEVGQTPTGTISFLRKDGTIFFAEAIGTFLTYKGKRCSMGIFRDITERRQAQEALRASEERYDLAVRGAGVGVWDWDIRTDNLYLSPRWRMLFGYDENDIGDSVEEWARLLHPDEKEWMLKFLEDFLAGTSPTVTVEYRLRHKNGSYRWIVATGIVLRDEHGKAYRFVGSHGDITDRKLAEEALERERQSLWRMLQASDHERQTISYEIHDGLTQYLAAANMQLQVFDGLRESNPKEAKKAYDAATQLVSQSHIEARRLISEVRPPVIDEIGVETAISHLVHEQRQRGGPTIKFDSDVQFGRLPAILENAIYRIVQEALTNACKHSKSKKVTVTVTQKGQEVRLEVRDWGIGFDPELVERGHFGLEGIRQRVRLLGGRLTIESTPGSGTLFRVVVPIVERQGEE